MKRRAIVLESEMKRSGGEERLWTPGTISPLQVMLAAMITNTSERKHLSRPWEFGAGLGYSQHTSDSNPYLPHRGHPNQQNVKIDLGVSLVFIHFRVSGNVKIRSQKPITLQLDPLYLLRYSGLRLQHATAAERCTLEDIHTVYPSYNTHQVTLLQQ
jgi:hypothetical protein